MELGVHTLLVLQPLNQMVLIQIIFDDNDLVGVGNSFQGLYISNGHNDDY